MSEMKRDPKFEAWVKQAVAEVDRMIEVSRKGVKEAIADYGRKKRSGNKGK